jgi:hypothetical protein
MKNSTCESFLNQHRIPKSGRLHSYSCKKFSFGSLQPIPTYLAHSFSTVVAYALSFFLPIILSEELGFSVGVSLCLATPPYAFACVFMFVEGWLGDKYRVRAPIIAYNSLQSIVGLCLFGWTKSAGIQYFGVFLVAAGSNATVPACLAYQANNVRGHWKRAYCSASLIMFGGAGGIVGALVFRSQDAPQYLPGIYASLA